MPWVFAVCDGRCHPTGANRRTARCQLWNHFRECRLRTGRHTRSVGAELGQADVAADKIAQHVAERDFQDGFVRAGLSLARDAHELVRVPDDFHHP